jgi:signal transduction histidine kinase/ligand-binding sensor domain-containing protein/DNA-binding response OmpR family regulator
MFSSPLEFQIDNIYNAIENLRNEVTVETSEAESVCTSDFRREVIVIRHRLVRYSTIFSFVLFYSLCPSAIADGGERIAPSLIFHRLNTTHGLSNNNVNDLLQDRLGFLWFATDDGLNRFDGYDFKIFRHLPDNLNSITDNTVVAITEDRQGHIWIGTKRGTVHRYDPITETFTKWIIKSDAIRENTITCIYEDSRQLIWIGTYRGGLYNLDPITGIIEHWQNIPGNPTSLSSNYVTSIIEDAEGRILIGTYYGLNRLFPTTRQSQSPLERFFAEDGNPHTMSSNIIWNLTKSIMDPDLVWIGTADGLTKYDTKHTTFTQIKIPNPDNLPFGTSAGSVVEEILEGERFLWIDSFAGLIRYHPSGGTYERFVSDSYTPHSIAHNHITGMIKDGSGVLWIATESGISYFSAKSTKFNNTLSGIYSSRGFDQLKGKNIKAITKTADRRMWFGTDEGLFYLYRMENDASNRDINVQLVHDTEKMNIWSITPGGADDLWIGTYGSGLFRLDLHSDTFRAVRAYDSSISIPSILFNKVVYRDSDNALWIGYWGYGLARLDLRTREYISWHHDANNPNSLSHNDVWAIHQDTNGRLWIGTNGGGLNLYHGPDGGEFTRWYGGDYRESAEDGLEGTTRGRLSSNSIYSICESMHTRGDVSTDTTVLWIGTNNGLNKFVIQNTCRDSDSSFRVTIDYFTTENGLADNSIKTILEDSNGNLWLGTSSGISFFNTQTNTFVNYTIADGIIGGDFNLTAAFKDEAGMIFMGAIEGLNYFDPAFIERSPYVPPVIISDFQIFNRSVSTDDLVFNDYKSIIYTDHITITHDQNVFSFRLAALDYNAPSSIEYAYMMEGFDQDWVYGGSRRFITYTNLNPGEYTFKARSTNSDGVWNDQIISMRVIITPPWWQTGWAMILYILVFVGGMWGIIHFQASRTKLQAELKMQEFESRHLREVENMKSRFFTNLSHEFRTPLTLIKGPLEQLINGRINDNATEYYKLLLRNTEKLQHLIDQLLELSQLEAETIPLKTDEYDLVDVLRALTDSFIPLAEQKRITLTFRSDTDRIPALFDSDKFEKIINNLLSNAFKFTPAGGCITVDISREIEPSIIHQTGSEIAVVSISDTGIGIHENYRQSIFDRFYQVEDSSKRNYGGSGIGLALVKELVTLHKWGISVTDREGGGSVFSIRIPVLKSCKGVYPAHKYMSGGTTEDIELNESHEKIENDGIGYKDSSHTGNSSKPTVLIVEDSADLRIFLSDLLRNEYDVIQAENADDGLTFARDTMPDLILSDIMMPGTDGIECCQRLKTDWQTSHIPVILLTAKALQDDKIQGLQTGADDYITKPFDADELTVRIRNLIEMRRRLRDKFRREGSLQPESVVSNSIDEEFMRTLMYTIEENLNNEDFNSEVLAQKLFVSRSQLHRKLQALTGQAPGEFIRIYKLKRAAQMIVENKLSITQIAYEVGFGSPAQFTRAFKKYFSCLPSEYNSGAHT